MRKFFGVWLLFCSSAVAALELTVFAGQQLNEDFEVRDDVSVDPIPNTTAGEDIRLYDGASYGVALDFVFQGNQNQRIGVMLTRSETEFGSNAGLTEPDISITHIHFTGTSYYPVGNWEPFVMAGIGAARYSPDDSTLNDDTFISGQIAGGTQLKVTQNLMLRAEAKWIPTFFNTDGAFLCSGGCVIGIRSDFYNQLQFNLGLQFRF